MFSFPVSVNVPLTVAVNATLHRDFSGVKAKKRQLIDII
jgi:hypothetical protein